MAVDEHGAVTFTIRGPIAPPDLPGLYARVCSLLEASSAMIVGCDVSAVDVDAVTVDALARLQLGAHRHGCRVRLLGASDDLRALVDLMGLQGVLTG